MEWLASGKWGMLAKSWLLNYYACTAACPLEKESLQEVVTHSMAVASEMHTLPLFNYT